MEQLGDSLGLKLRGCLRIHLKDAKTGEVLEERLVNNAPASSGIAWMGLHMLSGEGATSQVLQQLGIGTDTTAPTTGDTGLGSEFLRKAVGTWATGNMTATDGPNFQAQVNFATDEGNTTLAEAALFNSSAAGTMLAHATFGTIDKTTSNTLGVSYTITLNIT